MTTPTTPRLIKRTVETVRFVTRTYHTLHHLKVGKVSPRQAGADLARDVVSMGPLYTKLAQFISARKDALDPEFIEALSVVQDNAESSVVHQPPEVDGYEVFQVPIASASIADVYKGECRRTGRVVAIKRRRAGTKEAIETDLPLLMGVMTVASVMGVPGAKNMFELIDQSRSMVLRELDFRIEAKASRDFAAKMSDVAWLKIPEVLFSTEDVMVSHFEPSRKVSEVRGPNPPLARRLMDLYMMMLGAGVVHADPHPGNLGFLSDGSVVLYDFGAMLEVDSGLQHHVARMITAGISKNADDLLGSMESVGVLAVKNDSERGKVRRVLRRVLSSRNVHVELQNIPEFSSNAEQRLVTFGTTFIYLVRTLTLIDSSCRSLDPDFAYDFAQWVDPPDVMASLSDMARDVASLPSTINAMHSDLEEFQSRVLDDMTTFKRAMIVGGGVMYVMCLFYFVSI